MELAVGMAHGMVVLMRGNLARSPDEGGNSDVQQVFLEADEAGNPVTALHFREEDQLIHNTRLQQLRHIQEQQRERGHAAQESLMLPTAGPRVLYVVTSGSVTVYCTPTPGSKEIFREVLDEHDGCGVGASTMSDNQELVIGRSTPMEAVFFYGTEGRGATLGLEGDKQLLQWFRGYLIVVGNQTAAVGGSAQGAHKYNTFTVYDLKNKYVAYSENRFRNITQVVCEWGSVFVFCGGGEIWRLEEKDTQTKLDTLFRKNLYSVAINLAESQDVYDPALVVDIYRRYGDYLYSRGQGFFDDAMEQYKKTIGFLEPSYVIRKFLDAQRIYNLTSYLQALHEQPSSSMIVKPDHTTLLFNCYTQLKDADNLKAFIEKDNLHFDIDTAIRACRQAGYYEHALFLAKKHGAHDWHGKILLEDMHAYDDALNYIRTLDVFEAEELFQKHGKTLVERRPEATTQLLQLLCGCDGGWPALESSAPRVRARPADFIHIFVDQPRWLQTFLETVTEVWQMGGFEGFEETTSGDAFSDFDMLLSGAGSKPKVNPEKVVWNTLLELYLRKDDGHHVSAVSAPADKEEESDDNSGAAQPLERREHHVDHDDVHLELSLEERQENYRKALVLLQNPGGQYDEEHGLFLCKLHNFKDGLLYLYERMGLFGEILQYFIEYRGNDEEGSEGDFAKEGSEGPSEPGLSAFARESILRTCKRFGDDDSQLWLSALGHFATYPDVCHAEILEVLQSIDRDNLLPPLAVVQLLAKKPRAPLSLVRDYICRRLTLEADVIQENQRVIKNFQDETKKMRSEIAELQGRAKIFQLNKCTYCSQALDLPAIHFLCMHSFHQRCLPENESECPVCAPQNKKILEIKRSLAEAQHQHDSFFRQLKGSGDGFKTVADYFGRGLFDESASAAQTAAPPNTGGLEPLPVMRDDLPPVQQLRL
jgi:vacuolar protein sorting-associated protein 11